MLAEVHEHKDQPERFVDPPLPLVKDCRLYWIK
jgi:hypothetical protein